MQKKNQTANAFILDLQKKFYPRNYLEIGLFDACLNKRVVETIRSFVVDKEPLCERTLTINTKLFFLDFGEFVLEKNNLNHIYEFVVLSPLASFEETLVFFKSLLRVCSREVHIILVSGSSSEERKLFSDITFKLTLFLKEQGFLIESYELVDRDLFVVNSKISGLSLIRRKLHFLGLESFDRLRFFLRRKINKVLRRFLKKFFKKRKISNFNSCPCLRKEERTLKKNNKPIVPTRINNDSYPRMLGVLLCYNDADVLADSIESLLENNHHLVVWNHGSTDHTSEVLSKYKNYIIENTFLPREFDFYKLYPTVSQYLIENYIKNYDWISWPDQDEILEGPDRSKSYSEFVLDVLEGGYTHVRFDMFNFWFTEIDDMSISSTVERVRHYSPFPEFPSLMRAWNAKVTNKREFNHNSLDGNLYPHRFRLRHYPMRSHEQAVRRITKDRQGLQRGDQNIHYNSLIKYLDRLVISPNQLHFDDGMSNLHTSVSFDFAKYYGLV